ncbi:MAG: glycosyltransferase [Desulfovibrio sp.]|jgi:GT2 family glycosyltransferase|nr:glycosyltransferase [Desulfovibrio sp.]
MNTATLPAQDQPRGLFPRVAAIWAQLPEQTASALLLSAEGTLHLGRQAALLLERTGERTNPVLTSVLADIALAAWETSLLDAGAASVVRQIHEQYPFLGDQTAAFVNICTALRPRNPQYAIEANACLNDGDIDSAKKLIALYGAKEQGNLFWLRFASFLGIHLGELDWYEGWLKKLPPSTAFAPVFLADYAFARGDWSRAAELYARGFDRTSLPTWLIRAGECRRRLGEREAASVCWRKALGMRPWQSNLLFRLTDLERGGDLPGSPPAGRGEVLLYSWNHADDLYRTLEALAASRLGECGLTVLNNGSSDHTRDVIHSWQDRLGGRMRSIALPVNVGAPAARNWLLDLEASKAADWVAFLDDDALVPPDWLEYFGAALKQCPEAPIVGCRVVDMAAPLYIQSVDLHFTSGDRPAAEKKEGGAGGEVSPGTYPMLGSTHLTIPDFGQYSYLRPAVSVTGCCHLLTRANLDDIGFFDLRFSPSQFDDLERDLRSCAKGQYPLYQGHLCVRHFKRSGSLAGLSPWQQANVKGNSVKLTDSYPREQMNEICDKALRRLKSDFENRLGVISK